MKNQYNLVGGDINNDELITKDKFNNEYERITGIGDITEKGKTLISLLDKISENSKNLNNIKNFMENNKKNFIDIYNILLEYRNNKITKKKNDSTKLLNYFNTFKSNYKDNQYDTQARYKLYNDLRKIYILKIDTTETLNNSLLKEINEKLLDIVKNINPNISNIEYELGVNDNKSENILNFYKYSLLIIGELTQNEYYKHLFSKLKIIVDINDSKPTIPKSSSHQDDPDTVNRFYERKNLNLKKTEKYRNFYKTDTIAKLFILIINKCLSNKNYHVPLL